MFAILQKHCQSTDQRLEILEFFNHLYTSDLYVTIACAQSSNRAWSRFNAIYQRHIFDTAYRYCSNRTLADEVAESLAGHLYLSDATGNPRIQSYDGRVALTTWLRAIIAHKVMDELDRKYHRFARFDDLSDIPDRLGLKRPDAFVRAHRYGRILSEALRETFASLEKPERLLLELLYVEDLKSKEVAELFNTCKSNVTYHLKQVRSKLKREMIAVLRQKYQLGDEAIGECIEELLENPSYSVLTLIKAKG